MSADLLILDATAITAAAIAGGGVALGGLRFKRLNVSQRMTWLFLLASVVGELAGTASRALGRHNAWAGNLEGLAIPALLLPALTAAMPRDNQLVYRAVQRVAVLVWGCYFILGGHLFEFSPGIHACFCLVAVAAAVSLLGDACQFVSKLRRSPAFLLGVAACFACGCDIFPSVAYSSWMRGDNSAFIHAWSLRNASWAVGFAIMAYTLCLGGDHRE